MTNKTKDTTTLLNKKARMFPVILFSLLLAMVKVANAKFTSHELGGIPFVTCRKLRGDDMKEWTFDPKRLGYDFAFPDQLGGSFMLGTSSDRKRFLDVLEARLNRSNRKSLIFYVHGYNNPSEAALQTTQRLQAIVGHDKAVVVCIDFASLGKPWLYHPDKFIAETCAPLIAEFFKTLRDDGRFPADRCHLLCHSMANRIIEKMHKTFRAGASKPVFGSFVSTQADVARKSTNLGCFRAGTLAQRTYVLYSPHDSVLRASRVGNLLRREKWRYYLFAKRLGGYTNDVGATKMFQIHKPSKRDIKKFLLGTEDESERTFIVKEREGLLHWHGYFRIKSVATAIFGIMLSTSIADLDLCYNELNVLTCDLGEWEGGCKYCR